VALRLTVLAATTPTAVGTSYEERIDLSDQGMRRACHFAYLLGLIGQADFGKEREVDWGDARGRELIAEVIPPAGGVGRSKVAYAAFSAAAPHAASGEAGGDDFSDL
jgi:hypothetical protein